MCHDLIKYPYKTCFIQYMISNNQTDQQKYKYTSWWELPNSNDSLHSALSNELLKTNMIRLIWIKITFWLLTQLHCIRWLSNNGMKLLIILRTPENNGPLHLILISNTLWKVLIITTIMSPSTEHRRFNISQHHTQATLPPEQHSQVCSQLAGPLRWSTNHGQVKTRHLTYHVPHLANGWSL